MKLWVDAERPVPEGYIWCMSVDAAKDIIKIIEREYKCHHTTDGIELIDTDYDAGIYAKCGGDYIKLLDWLEETGRNYPIHIHSMNPVCVENMRRIIRKNDWREV